jgi:hypothetical protein
VSLTVLAGGARERPTVRDEHGMLRVKVQPGTWVRARNGGGYIHAVDQLHIFRNEVGENAHGIHHVFVKFGCPNGNYDDRLMEVAVPNVAFPGAKVCWRCVGRVLGR